MKILTNKFFWLVLITGATISAGTSLAVGLGQSVWFDEAYSILLSQQSWTDIVMFTAKDVHPPVYYWLLKAWMQLFGSGELALRSLSALLLGLSVVMAGVLIRRLFGAKTALLTLPFLIAAPFLLRYGFEIRMYSLASLIGLTATYVLLRAIGEKQKTASRVLFAAYALLVTLGVYTLYFTALIWITHLAWVGWLAYKEKRFDNLVPAIVAYGVAALLFLPWMPIFLGKASGSTLSPVTSSLDADNLLGILTYSFLYQPPWSLGLADILYVVAVLATVITLGAAGYKVANAAERRSIALLGLYFIAPVFVLVVVTQFKPIYLERYIAHFVIGIYACLGVLAAIVWQRCGKLARASAGLLLFILMMGCISLLQYGNYNFQRVHAPSVKQAAQLLGSCKDGAVIFADGPQVAMELGYYVTDCPVYFFNETLTMGGGFAMLSGSPLRVADASIRFKDTDRLFYVYYNKPQRALPEAMKVVDVVEMNKLYVATYARADVH